MVHNKFDVVIGGGVKYLSEGDKKFLQDEGYGVFLDDITGFKNFKGNRMWALFGEVSLAYEIDRNPEKEPSLAEMTKIAIEKLSKNKNGFFLMVEGSMIDWAAHGNDAAAMITEMLAFDEACGVALDFAKADGNTAVVIVPDHGNSGFSIGSNKCPGYSSLTKDQLFGNVSKIKTSVTALAGKLNNTEPVDLQGVFSSLTGISLKFSDYVRFMQCSDYKRSPLPEEERTKGLLVFNVIAEIINRNNCFGFTTTGHTGEEVFLAVYDPTKNRLTGHRTNIELNHYLRKTMGFKQSLESLTNDYFAKHTEVFANYSFTITNKNNIPVLEIKSNNNVMEIHPNTNIVKFNEKEIKLNTVVVHVKENDTFYLPRSLRNLLATGKW
jgi:alkaline phosphatase